MALDISWRKILHEQEDYGESYDRKKKQLVKRKYYSTPYVEYWWNIETTARQISKRNALIAANHKTVLADDKYSGKWGEGGNLAKRPFF